MARGQEDEKPWEQGCHTPQILLHVNVVWKHSNLSERLFLEALPFKLKFKV